jgi:hypothetical protein
MKRLGIGLVLVVVLGLSSVTASAQASTCYEISKVELKIKEGQYENAKCEGAPTPHLLEGKWVLVEELTQFKTEDLWCAKIRLVLPENISGEDGYYTTAKCEVKNGEGALNASDFTEVVVPNGMVLPEFITKTGWTGTSGAGKLATAAGDEIKCTAGTNEGTMEASKKLGTFVLRFTGCKSEKPIAGVTCNSSGDAAETVLTTGSWHLVLTIIGGVDKHLIWFLVTPLVVKCSIFEFKISGNVLGSITPPNTLTKVYHLGVNVPTAGHQEFTTFENDGGEHVQASLVSNGEAATEESASNTIATEKDTLIIN